jgi:hypothetical protein
MKDVLVFVAAVIGGTMLAFGNDLGLIGIMPALVVSIADSKHV